MPFPHQEPACLVGPLADKTSHHLCQFHPQQTSCVYRASPPSPSPSTLLHSPLCVYACTHTDMHAAPPTPEVNLGLTLVHLLLLFKWDFLKTKILPYTFLQYFISRPRNKIATQQLTAEWYTHFHLRNLSAEWTSIFAPANACILFSHSLLIKDC